MVFRGFVFFLSIFFATVTYAEQTQQPPADEVVTIKKSDLTPEQIAKAAREEQANTLRERLGEYSDYAQMGRGIGIAVGESLGAVKDVAVDFSKTEVGKFTLFLIAWKVMARDVISMGDTVVGFIIGPAFLLVGGLVLIWSYRRQCMPRRVLVADGKDTGKRWVILAPNGETIEIKDGKTTLALDGRGAWAIGHVVVGFLLLVVFGMITFAGN